MSIVTSYFTISHRGASNYRVLGSRHIGATHQVNSEASIKAIIDETRKEYHDATHVCYAWRLGWKKDKFRYSDDGEPSGTAGRPIYGQILSFDLTDVLVTVVRHYGGTKLGTGGLIDAYKTAAQLAIENSGRIELPVQADIRFEFPYAAMAQVMKLIKTPGIEKISMHTESICTLHIRVPISMQEQILAGITQIHGAKVKAPKG